jgi:hypothetical protein
MRLKELAATRGRYGYRRLHILPRREGWLVNHKRTYRLYDEEGLSIRPNAPRHVRLALSAGSVGGGWAQRGVGDRLAGADQLFDGRPFRILTVVEAPDEIAVRQSTDVIALLAGLATVMRDSVCMVKNLRQQTRLGGRKRFEALESGKGRGLPLLSHVGS